MIWYFARPEVGASVPAFSDLGLAPVRRLRSIIAAVVAAATLAGATTAKAGLLFPSGLPDSSQMANTGLCDASACPSYLGSPESWTVYQSFTLNQASTITGFGFYSYFDGASTADYVSTNWSIWADSMNAPVTSASLDSMTSSGSAVQASGPTLVTVGDISVDLAAGTYWIGFQNNFLPDTGYSTYATTDESSSVYFGQLMPALTEAYYKKVAFYIDGTYNIGAAPPPPGVPEPSTWAMTLFGFAGLGWLARRRIARPGLMSRRLLRPDSP